MLLKRDCLKEEDNIHRWGEDNAMLHPIQLSRAAWLSLSGTLSVGRVTVNVHSSKTLCQQGRIKLCFIAFRGFSSSSLANENVWRVGQWMVLIGSCDIYLNFNWMRIQ